MDIESTNQSESHRVAVTSYRIFMMPRFGTEKHSLKIGTQAGFTQRQVTPVLTWVKSSVIFTEPCHGVGMSVQLK